jgi:hypothetical protein
MANSDTTNKTNSGGKLASVAPPITVDNPAHAASFAIDQDVGADSVHQTKEAAAQAPRPVQPDVEPKIAIAKPTAFNLDKFRSTCEPTCGGVETLLTALPHLKINEAKDFVRVHTDEAYWSPELCFVNVPTKGMKRDTLHLISEGIAMQHLASGQIQRFRLALATKPHDVFFLCHVPSTNLDNSWNMSNWLACDEAKTHWVQATSRKGEQVEGYKINYARNPAAFPAPRWPKQSLNELIAVTFAGRMIETNDHPGLLRLVGDVQAIT